MEQDVGLLHSASFTMPSKTAFSEQESSFDGASHSCYLTRTTEKLDEDEAGEHDCKEVSDNMTSCSLRPQFSVQTPFGFPKIVIENAVEKQGWENSIRRRGYTHICDNDADDSQKTAINTRIHIDTNEEEVEEEKDTEVEGDEARPRHQRLQRQDEVIIYVVKEPWLT